MIETVIQQRRKSLGGLEVGRVLPFAAHRMVGPFVFFDHLGPVDLAPGLPHDADVRPHPHIGLSTVTYLFSGEMMHRDSVGSEQAIKPGEVNWMVAGRGITHSERFEHARQFGDHLNGIQSWVALPEAFEETDPSFAHYSSDALPTWQEGPVWSRLIAGEAFGQTAATRIHSPLFYIHQTLPAGGRSHLPDGYRERAAYVVSGRVDADHRTFTAGEMIVFSPGHPASLQALEPSVLMLLGGEPLGERFLFWNFVSSSKARLEEAKADWRAGRMKLPDLDHDEFTPLPE